MSELREMVSPIQEAGTNSTESRSKGAASILVFALAFGSCDTDLQSPSGVVVWDSLGVSIVEHTSVPSDTVRAGPPILTIGREGEPEYEFSRVIGVQPLSDGRIVVGDGGSQELRYYSVEGEHLQSLGGQGEGPGEFQFLNHLQRIPGDTIVANDARTRRATFFSPTPEFVETLSYIDRFEESRPDDMAVCAFPSYAGLIAPRVIVTRDWACARAEGSEGVRPHRSRIHVWPAGAVEPLILGPFTVSAVYERPDREPRQRFAFLRLAERSVIVVAAGAVYVTSPSRHEVTVLTPGGFPTMIIRDRMPRREIDQDLGPSVMTARTERNRDLPLPDSLPPFDRVVVGAGQIWMRHFSLPADSVKYWSVYGAGGVTKTVVGFPSAFDLTAVLAGRAYGIATSGLGIERIQVFDVDRGH